MARTHVRAALVACATFACPGLAAAHFHLDAPENWITQMENGDPQKTGPCGALMEMNKTYTASGAVTPFKAGDTVTIKLEETVSHPGHYRVALAVSDRSELPPEPMVTKKDDTMNGQCGSVPIMDPPVFPILADGELKDATPQSGQQTITVKLPDDIECDKCTLQVLEFMSDHSAPCFYHHCADISITKDGGGTGGMSAGGMSAGGASNAGMSAGGMSAGGMSAGGAGAVSNTGGMSGSAGSPIVPSAGMPGVSGSTGAGGTTTTGGTGGSPTTGGTGGSMTTTGGAGGTGATSSAGSPTGAGGTGTQPTNPAAKPETDDEGGCTTTPGKSSSPWALAALLGLAALRARRRR